MRYFSMSQIYFGAQDGRVKRERSPEEGRMVELVVVRMGSEFSAVILRNLTRGEFSVGTKLPRECNFEKTQRIQKFSGSVRRRS